MFHTHYTHHTVPSNSGKIYQAIQHSTILYNALVIPCAIQYNSKAYQYKHKLMSIHIKALIPPKEPGIAPQKRNYEARAKEQTNSN